MFAWRLLSTAHLLTVMLSLETVSRLKTVLRHILDVLVLVLFVDVSVIILVLNSLFWASVKTV